MQVTRLSRPLICRAAHLRARTLTTTCVFRQKSGTELHYKPPAIVEAERTVDSPYDDHSRLAYEDWVVSHPVYTDEELHSVQVVHHKIESFPDRLADWIVRFCRFGTDLATRYTHHTPLEIAAEEKKLGRELSVAEMRERRLIMRVPFASAFLQCLEHVRRTPDEWLLRTLYLESLAAVPGMVAAVLRHLRSLRVMKRDGGFIHTLLQEAENERMHLLCFMTIKQPGPFFRFLLLGAQGVFTNLLFLLYIVSPRTMHRFVQRLEVEAVYTYTMLIEEIEAGRFPEWKEMKAPQIAIDYWRLPEGKRGMLDMIYAIRADESQHRFVNGTLANLQASDVNPFGLHEPPAVIRGTRAEFSREEALQWSSKVTNEAKRRHLEKMAQEPTA